MKFYSQQEISDFCFFLKEHRSNYLKDKSHIDSIIEVASHCLYDRIKPHDICVGSFDLVCQFLSFQLAQEKEEVFAALFLDTQHRLIAFEKLFHGSISHCEICPRVIARKALELEASGIIIAHNHPSCNLKPSEADIKLTKRLTDALTIFDIEILDHIIIGGQETISLARLGYLTK